MLPLAKPNALRSQRQFWRGVLLPIFERYRRYDIPKLFAGDAVVAEPNLKTLLENVCTPTPFESRPRHC